MKGLILLGVEFSNQISSGMDEALIVKGCKKKVIEKYRL